MATLSVKIEDKESSLLATILVCTSHVTSNDANYPEEFMEFHPSSLPSLLLVPNPALWRISAEFEVWRSSFSQKKLSKGYCLPVLCVFISEGTKMAAMLGFILN